MLWSRLSSLALVVLLAAGCDDAPPAAASPPHPVGPPAPGLIRIMGTGAMTPLASLLAREWNRRSGVPKVVVEPSVGSTGGVQAASDGAVELGMIARRLSSAEQALGLAYVPIARDAVVVAAHRDAPVNGLSSAQLLALFSGDSAQFPDGSPAMLILRDRADSAHAALEQTIPSLEVPRLRAYDTHRFQVIFHDDVMGATLASSVGALGVFSLGAITAWQLPLKVLAVDGVLPTAERVQDGTWKSTRELAFLVRHERMSYVAGFLRYVMSPEADDAMKRSEYVPVHGAPP